MAKATPDVTTGAPAAEGERNFVKIHKIKQVAGKVVNTAKGVKVFDRAAHNYGNDQAASIAAYDPVAAGVRENVAAVMTKVLKRVNHKNNKKVKPVKGIKEAEEFKVGDPVHIGLRIRGGAGFRGKLESVDEHGMAKVRLSEKDYQGHPRTVRGHISRCTKEIIEVDPETPVVNEEAPVVEEGLKDFSAIVKELSSGTLSNYVKKADDSGRKMDGEADNHLQNAAKAKPNSPEREKGVNNYQKTKKKADKRFGLINTALDKLHAKSENGA